MSGRVTVSGRVTGDLGAGFDRVVVLPPPTEDMDDETAALWLYELAEVYDGYDRVVVRALAYRLRARSEGCS